MTFIDQQILNSFVLLINEFVIGRMDAKAFEKEYLDLWRKFRDTSEINEINAKSGEAIDKLFTAVDAFCADPTLQDENDIDENQLKRDSKEVLDALKKLSSQNIQ